MTGPANIPERIGRYEIRDVIGTGRYATVYRAYSFALVEEVALKVLDPRLSQDRAWVKRYLEKLGSLQELEHPGIATIHDAGEADELLYIAMDWVPGGSLHAQLKEWGAYRWEDLLAILEPLCDALEHAHHLGWSHLDLKPSNILFRNPQSPCITDFGLSHAIGDNRFGIVLSEGITGHPAYMAPEIWEGTSVAPGVDIYALGCITYECLTGQPLFQGDDAFDLMRAHALGPDFDTDWPDDVPVQIEAILNKALAANPEDRYATANEFWSAMQDAKLTFSQHRVASFWEERTQQSIAAEEWRVARMAVGRWLSAIPGDPAAIHALHQIERALIGPEAVEEAVEEPIAPPPGGVTAPGLSSTPVEVEKQAESPASPKADIPTEVEPIPPAKPVAQVPPAPRRDIPPVRAQRASTPANTPLPAEARRVLLLIRTGQLERARDVYDDLKARGRFGAEGPLCTHQQALEDALAVASGDKAPEPEVEPVVESPPVSSAPTPEPEALEDVIPPSPQPREKPVESRSPEEARARLLIRTGQWDGALMAIRDVQRTGDLPADLADDEHIITTLQRAEQYLVQGSYAMAHEELVAAQRDATALIGQVETKSLVRAINNLLEAVNFINEVLLRTARSLASVVTPTSEHWSMITNALETVAVELADYPNATISGMQHANLDLQRRFEADASTYQQTCRRVQRQYPNHPFLDICKQWQAGSEPLAAWDIESAKQAILNKDWSRAYGLLQTGSSQAARSFIQSEGQAWLDVMDLVRQGWLYISELRYTHARVVVNDAVTKAVTLVDQDVSQVLGDYARQYREAVQGWIAQLQQAVTQASNQDKDSGNWDILFTALKRVHALVLTTAGNSEACQSAITLMENWHNGMAGAFRTGKAAAYKKHLAMVKETFGADHPYSTWYETRAKDLDKGGGPVSTILTVVGALIAVIVLTIAIIVGVRSCQNDDIAATATPIDQEDDGGGGERSTRVPSATNTPEAVVTQEDTLAHVDSVTEVCDRLQELRDAGEWLDMLERAENLETLLGDDYVATVQAVTNQGICSVDYSAMVVEAGEMIAKEALEQDPPDYVRAKNQSERAYDLALGFFEENDPVLLPLLRYRACASYKVFDIENSKDHSTDLTEARTQAREALNALLPYEDQGVFYSDFVTLCSVDFYTASDAIVEPTATPTPMATTPPRPPTETPGGNENGDNGNGGGGTTCQPVAPTALVWPSPGDGLASGWTPDKPFQWEGGDLCNKQYVWQVKFATIEGDPLGPDCPATQDSLSFCTLPSYAGEIQWWVAATNADGTQTFVESEKRILNLQEQGSSNGGNLCPDGSPPRPGDNCP